MQTDLDELDAQIQNTPTKPFSGSLFKKKLTASAKKKIFNDISASLTEFPSETSTYNDTTFLSTTVINDLADIRSTNGADAYKCNLDGLYMQFFEIWQMHRNDLLDSIKELATTCLDTLSYLKQSFEYQQVDVKDKTFIENEYSTWCLLHSIYMDRLHAETNCELPQYFGLSEKLCALSLFKRDSLVRESQLVIDWLEAACALREDDNFQHVTAGWENTLHELKSKETLAFKSTDKIVSKLDPDAPHYQQMPLHDLDMDDEKRLCQRVFRKIRCGQLSEAQQFCIDCGHGWRAALLEGWRLYHNPYKTDKVSIEEIEKSNENSSLDTNEKSADEYKGEGNETRDIWKLMAYEYCQEPDLNAFEKAAVAAYCGHLQSLLAVGQNWEDDLWAYLRMMIDIRVESEIRDCVNKKYMPMPDEYWDQRMSLNDVFLKLESSPKAEVYLEATNALRIIQKYLILDDIGKLFNYIDEIVDESNVTTQFLRFLVHLVLFLEHVTTTCRRDVVEKLLEFYIKRLADMQETELVAFYVSKINLDAQIQLYASHLEHILDNEKRKAALVCAEDNGLNIFATTKQIVENIRRKPHQLDPCGELQAKLTENDDLKISALDWVLFYESQRLEALIQSNALIFSFLTLKKLDAAQLAFNKIPVNSVDYILSEGDITDETNQIIREHLSYKAYIDAQRAFNAWFKQFNFKPIEPEAIPENVQFTEKVAYQHRLAQYKAETERWKLTMSQLTKSTKTYLYNVLFFPDGGWLDNVKDGDFLRSLCIPECVLLLYNVLSKSNLHEECIQLADILVSEKHGLYKVYTDEKLVEILTKLTEISVALLNEKKDPWGNPPSP